MNIGFALCGSFCTYQKVFPVLETLAKQHTVTPIFSQAAYTTDSRFGTAAEHIAKAEAICGAPPLHTTHQVEPIGPKKLLDLVLVAPCTGNSMAKIAGGISDTPVTLAVKSHLRNARPVLIAPSTNDGLAGNAANIGRLMAMRNVYIAPFGQDDPDGKPTSLVAKWELVPEACAAALEGRQLQPMLM